MTDEGLGLELISDSQRYAGWKSIRVTQSIESIAGSFALEVSDRWSGQKDPWPIAEFDPCTVTIDSEIVIDGYVSKRNLGFSESSRTLSYEGRDAAGELVDCSAIVDAGKVSKSKWTFNNVNVVDLARKICEPFDIPVSAQAGLEKLLTKNKKIVLQPGDTCFEVIAKVAGAAGVLVVSDGAGGIVITRTGKIRATALVEGHNIRAGSVTYDATSRFYRYLLSSQVPGTDEASGAATRVQAEAIDEGVPRKQRVLLVRPEKGYSKADSRARADWEARIRAAKAEKYSITVRGWRQSARGGRSDGPLWKVNQLAHVFAPRGLGVDGELLISEVEFSVGPDGQMTQLGLMRPDAFTPEPVTAVVKGSAGGYKELVKGGKYDAKFSKPEDKP